MRTFMLVGKTGCGKTTLRQALAGLPIEYKKTQTIEAVDGVLDTPGEYFENRRYNKALQVSSTAVDVVVLLQDCSEEQSVFAPKFAAMFYGKPIIGVVSKSDLGTCEEHDRSRRFLTEAGCRQVVRVSAVTGEGLEKFCETLAAIDDA